MIYKFDEFVLDRGAFRLVRGQEEVHLKPRVLELLVYLVERQGRLVTKQEILGELWKDRFVSDGVLSSSIYEARMALGNAAGEEHFIQTVHGRGYRFVAEVEQVAPPPADSGKETGANGKDPGLKEAAETALAATPQALSEPAELVETQGGGQAPFGAASEPPDVRSPEFRQNGSTLDLSPDPGLAISSTAAAPARPRRSRTWGRAALALGIALIAVLLWSASRGRPVRDGEPITRLSLAWAVEPLAKRVGQDREIEFAALSPDGRVIVYHSGGQLQVRRLEALESEPLLGTEGGRGAFFSPDGEWVGFFTDTELKKVAARGGRPETIAQVSAGWCGSWGTDDTIVFGRSGITTLWSVPATGGKPEPLTHVAGVEADHDWPALLPGRRVVLFANAEVSYALGEAQIVAQSLDTGERKVLVEGGTYPRYSPSGHLLYAHNGALFAVRLDPERLEVLGRPVRVVDGLQQGRNGSAQYSVGQDGTLLYVRGGSQWPRTRPVWVDRSGVETATAVTANHFAHQALSRDGSRIAVEVREQHGADLWIYELMSGRASRLTFDRAGVSDPIWSLDDSEVYFTSSIEGGRGKIFRKRSDGTGKMEWLADALIKPRSLSADGRLLGIGYGDGTDRDITMLQLTARGQPVPLIATPARELDPQLSPDGKWIAYVSDESGRNEIYVRPFPNVQDGRWQVSNLGGLFPRWHPRGGELFYLEGSSLMAVEIGAETVFQGSVPRRLFDGPYVGTLGDWGGFGVSPDGERFLLYEHAIDSGEAEELILVLNWFDELERLVSVE